MHLNDHKSRPSRAFTVDLLCRLWLVCLVWPCMAHAELHFVTQPSPQAVTAAAGYGVELFAGAIAGSNGVADLVWYLNGAPAPGNNQGATYNFTLSPATAGTYTLHVSNGPTNTAVSNPIPVAIGGPGSPWPTLVG